MPFEVTLYLAEEGTVHSTPEAAGQNIKESRTYRLYAVCCNVVDPVNPEATSLVSCINVGPSYHARYTINKEVIDNYFNVLSNRK